MDQDLARNEWNEIYDAVKKEFKPKRMGRTDGSKVKGIIKTMDYRTYKLHHQFDELDLLLGKVNDAEEIHHILPVSKGNNKQEMRFIAQHPMNLMCLSKKNHYLVHYDQSSFTPEQLVWIRTKYQIVLRDLQDYVQGKLPADAFEVTF